MVLGTNIMSDTKFIIPFLMNLWGQGRLPSNQLQVIYKLNWKQLFGLFETEFKHIEGWTALLLRTASDEVLSKDYHQCKQSDSFFNYRPVITTKMGLILTRKFLHGPTKFKEQIFKNLLVLLIGLEFQV